MAKTQLHLKMIRLVNGDTIVASLPYRGKKIVVSKDKMIVVHEPLRTWPVTCVIQNKETTAHSFDPWIPGSRDSMITFPFSQIMIITSPDEQIKEDYEKSLEKVQFYRRDPYLASIVYGQQVYTSAENLLNKMEEEWEESDSDDSESSDEDDSEDEDQEVEDTDSNEED